MSSKNLKRPPEHQIPAHTAPKVSRRTEDRLLDAARSQKSILSHLVLMQRPGETPFTVIQSAADDARQKLNYENDTATGNSILSIGNETLAQGEFGKKKQAKVALAEIGLKELQKTCFTIVVKEGYASAVVVKKEQLENEEKLVIEDRSIVNGSLGAKMMKKMGWTGGGLGAQGQGRTNCIHVTLRRTRRGLGSEDDKKLLETIEPYIKEYVPKDSLSALLFSGFSKEERAVIHNRISRTNLCSKSVNRDGQRVLVVSHRISRWELVERIHKAGGETEEYKLIYPNRLEC